MRPTGSQIVKLVVEVAFIVLAVIIALAVDQWWEDRENDQLGARMLEAVAREIENNRAQVVGFGQAGDPDEILEGLNQVVSAYRASGQATDAAVNWDVTLLSSSAWETAQLTRATQYMDLQRVLRLAEVYEFQDFYLATQEGLVGLIPTVESRMQRDSLGVFLELRSRFGNTLSLRRTLATIYACALREMDAADSLLPEDCPEAGAGNSDEG